MEAILRVNQLEKSYGDKKVVQGVSFEVGKGEILCLPGPNGVGKSTTINIICGILDDTSGEFFMVQIFHVKSCVPAAQA
jgi:ABC-2 type transport system ATP-binding protein